MFANSKKQDVRTPNAVHQITPSFCEQDSEYFEVLLNYKNTKINEILIV